MLQVDQMMRQAVSDGVFPGGVLLVSAGDSVVFFEAYGHANLLEGRLMARNTIFDLASLTKPLATTLAVMRLVQQSRLKLEQGIGSILPPFVGTGKEQIRIQNLLCHNSGLPDHRPYYKSLCELDKRDRKDALRRLLLEEPLIHPAGEQVLYSDLGFMILCWVVEQVSGDRLDRFVGKEVYTRLGLENLFFVDLDAAPRKANFAATERCPWRKVLLCGAVHDDNAYAVGGVDGHAGLFGAAEDVYRLLSALLFNFHGHPAIHVFEQALLREFFKPQGNTGRALGFDMPSAIESSCGRFFSKRSVGHLGFTGTSFWMDLDRDIIVILLTNRIHPSRDNNRIKTFRPKLHDKIMKNIASVRQS